MPEAAGNSGNDADDLRHPVRQQHAVPRDRRVHRAEAAQQAQKVAAPDGRRDHHDRAVDRAPSGISRIRASVASMRAPMLPRGCPVTPGAAAHRRADQPQHQVPADQDGARRRRRSPGRRPATPAPVTLVLPASATTTPSSRTQRHADGLRDQDREDGPARARAARTAPPVVPVPVGAGHGRLARHGVRDRIVGQRQREQAGQRDPRPAQPQHALLQPGERQQRQRLCGDGSGNPAGRRADLS